MPELYQLIGTVLRDIAEARHMSDLYSRQVSHRYEQDSLLRRFPVPRAEISEAEFELKFAVEDVSSDSLRHAARSARLSVVFDDLSRDIVREAMQTIKDHLEGSPGDLVGVEAAETWRMLDSKDYRDQLVARFLRYFEENQSEIIVNRPADKEGQQLNKAEVLKTIGDYINRLQVDDPHISQLFESLHPDRPAKIVEDIQKKTGDVIDQIQPRVAAAFDQCNDFKVQVNIKPEAIQAAGAAVSSVKVKAIMKNYIWDKIDIDHQIEGEEVRSVRALNPEQH